MNLKLSVHNEDVVERDGSDAWDNLLSSLREDAGLYNNHATLYFGGQNDLGGYHLSCSLAGLHGQCSTLVAYNLPNYSPNGDNIIKTLSNVLRLVGQEMGYAMLMVSIATLENDKSNKKVKAYLDEGWTLVRDGWLNYRTDLTIWTFIQPLEEYIEHE